MPVVVLHPRVDAQIIDVLSHTLEQFGEARYFEYRGLIGRPGRARHLFLYRIRDAVEVASFLYDAMDLPRQRPREW